MRVFSRFLSFLLRSAFLLSLVLLVGCTREEKKAPALELPVFGDAPTFSLLDTSGAPYVFTSKEEQYRVVSFFFSRCPSICPKINGALKETFDKVKNREDVLFVSVSVDPDHDTPEVLSKYAAKYRGAANEVGSQRWKFLTGSQSIVDQLLNKDFQLASGELPDEHNTRIVLVDPEGQIRGFYQGMDEEHLARFQKEFKQILG